MGMVPLLFVVLAATMSAQEPAALFRSHCAACHRADSPTRAPLPEALGALSADAVLRSLESGSMRTQGAQLRPEQRAALAKHIGKGSADRVVVQAGFCAPDRAPRTNPSWNGWGVDAANTRFQPLGLAGLDGASVPKLWLAWVFGFPGAIAAVSQPTVVGGAVYFGSMDGTIHAVDARTGCEYWRFKAEATVRSSISVGAIKSARYALLFGDTRANVYAVDVPTGRLEWKVRVDDHPRARVTGAPKLHENRLYVPVSSDEEVPAGNAAYKCCTFRGSVVALDIETGGRIWKTPTTESGAGAAVWSSPTIDTERRTLYVGTGNGYVDPAPPTSDSVLAIHMDTGKLLWHRQLVPDDSWNFSCAGDKRNCPKPGPDHDIAASPVLAGGMLIVAQKSGVVHALAPDERGRVVWRTQVGRGSALGGVMWGVAVDEENVYVPVSDVLTPAPGGLHALDIATGAKRWHTPTPGVALMAAATAIPGAVLTGGMDGVVRAHATSDGKLLWEFDTRRDFETVNGVKARGGSINGGGPVVVGGMVYVMSGYGMLGGKPGNALVAFSAEPR